MKDRKVPHKIPADVFPPLREFIERECGIILGEDKTAHVSAVLQERMRATGTADPWEYILSVMNGPRAPEERKRLIGGLVVGETSFFRNPDQFRVLQDHLLPAFLAAGAALPLQVWSAGCATGEEPYSIAMAALEAFRGRFIEPVRILATDIHTEFLEVARRGVYPLSAVRKAPPIYLMRYFTTLPDGTVRVKEEVRRLITFEERSLTGFASAPLPAARYSAIFCRNVMIYFRSDTTRRIVRHFFESLEDEGVLFLGHSETLWGISDAFRLERKAGAYYYRRAEGSQESASVPSTVEQPVVPSVDFRRGEAPPAGPSRSPAAQEDGRSACLALVARAEKMADREMFDEAERLCREAIDLDPACPEASHLLAVVLRRRGRISEALASAQRAHSADNGFVLAVVEIAECLSLLGRSEEASVCWEETFRMLEGQARFPRLSSGAGFSAKALREYVVSRILG
jgi:chemotaxis protein methyltransferase CheR